MLERREPCASVYCYGLRQTGPRSGTEFWGVLHMSKRVLILGGGFGGIYAALRLEKLFKRRHDIEVTLITRENFFLFTPMLHEVASSELELSTIVNPLRKLLRHVNTFIGSIDEIDIENRRVFATHGLDGHAHELPYDHLILALGSTPTSSICPASKSSRSR
jgi:NADH dehydrogenase FAD-containing subunit